MGAVPMSERSRTALVYDDIYLTHSTGPWHPESPERLRAIVRALRESSTWSQLHLLRPRRAELRWLEEVHSRGYVEQVRRTSESGGGALDGDTPVSERSFEVALYAVGGVLEAVDAVCTGRVQNAFCAVRPPGHHALPDRGMGFCLFNNVAIGARYAQRAHGLERILIVDWDVHHGNGTQAVFYEDPTVFYFSLHQYPHYPGTGLRTETGSGAGEGTTLNLPLSPGAGDEEYERLFLEELVPRAREFGPQLVFISAGFDVQQGDPLGGMRITETGFRRLTQIVDEIARSSGAQGRVISVLEGGYALEALGRSVTAHVRALIDCTRGEPKSSEAH